MLFTFRLTWVLCVNNVGVNTCILMFRFWSPVNRSCNVTEKWHNPCVALTQLETSWTKQHRLFFFCEESDSATAAFFPLLRVMPCTLCWLASKCYGTSELLSNCQQDKLYLSMFLASSKRLFKKDCQMIGGELHSKLNVLARCSINLRHIRLDLFTYIYTTLNFNQSTHYKQLGKHNVWSTKIKAERNEPQNISCNMQHISNCSDH